MKKHLIVSLVTALFIFTGCTGNKVDSAEPQKNGPAVSKDSTNSDIQSAPKDSTMADSFSNAPKMPG